jgi:hypothetical protein
MKKVILLLCLTMVGSAAAYAQEKQEKHKKKSKTEERRPAVRLEIEFISVGQGIDAESLEKIENYANNHPKKPAYNVVKQGREGERKLYFGLTELTPEEQTAFIEDVKKMIVKPELVKVTEPMKSTGKKGPKESAPVGESKSKKSGKTKPTESAK